LNLVIGMTISCSLTVLLDTIECCYSEYPLKSVKSLRISCTKFTDTCIDTLNAKCPKLEKLELQFTSAAHTENLTDSMFQHIKHLHSFWCFAGRELTDKTLISIAEGNPELKIFDFSYCKNITDSGLECLVDNCPKITVLSVSGLEKVSGRGLKYVADKLGANLTTFEIQGSFADLQDETLIHISQNCPKLSSLQFQTELNPQVTEKGLLGFIDNLEQISRFSIWNYKQFSYEAVKKIFSKISLKTIEFVNSYLKEHNDNIFDELHENVETLALKLWEDRLNDEGAKKIADRCPKLKSLGGPPHKITDTGKKYLTEKIPNLKLHL